MPGSLKHTNRENRVNVWQIYGTYLSKYGNHMAHCGKHRACICKNIVNML